MIRNIASAICAAFLLATIPASAAAPAAASAKSTYYYMVFSNPVAGTETEYNDWYQNRHQYDVGAVPGIVSFQRFIASDVQLRTGAKAPPQKYLIVYKIVTDDLPAVQKEIGRRVSSGETYVSPTFDTKTAGGGVYKWTGPEAHHKGAKPSEDQTYIHIVFNNAKPGTDEAFAKWYPGEHVPDMVAVPGFTKGQFSVLDPAANRRKDNKKYMSVFTIQTNDIKKVADAFHNAPKMHIDASFDPTQVDGYTYKAMEPEMSSDAIRAMRAAAKK